jgi:uncharacterized coiled-coil protein SlyX
MTKQVIDPVITKSMLEENNQILLDEISGIFSDFAERVDDRFNKVESRLDKIEFRLIRIEDDIKELKERVGNLDEKYDHIITALDAFLRHLKNIDDDNVAREVQLARFDRWLHEIAAKVGVKLEA